MIGDQCSNCGASVSPETRNYRYSESGLPNVVLQGIRVAECSKCGNEDVTIPWPAKIHRAIAHALINSPARLTGHQLRFLRKHLALSGDQLGRYLHTEKTKISKWERGTDRIGPPTDRLIRLLAASLAPDLVAGVTTAAEHLPRIADTSGDLLELHVNAATLKTAFLRAQVAA